MIMSTPKRHRGTVAAGAVATLAVLLAGCGGSAPEVPGAEQDSGNESGGGELTVGSLLPYTGEYSWVGENVEEVEQMIVEEINSSGGIDGQEINLVRGDTEGTVDAGVLAARKLANTDQAVAFVGPTSLSFTGVRQVIEDTGTPIVTPTAGTVEFETAGQSLFYRTVPSDSLGGRAIAKAITDAESVLGGESFDNVSLMVGDAPALVSFEEPIVSAMEEFGQPLDANIRFTPGRESYRSEVAEILRENPEMIILVGSPADSAKIMRQAQQSGYDGSWFVTQDQTNEDYIKLTGADVVEGIYGLQEAAPEAAADLRDTFTEALGHEPDIFQTNAYDSVNVLTLAMYAAAKEDGEVTRETIDAHIPGVANPEDGDVVVTSFEEGKGAIDEGKGIDYQGLSGPVDFDEYGNITSPFEVMQVQGGEFAPVSVIEAEQLQ
jgi:ABC-type branched-subunit amino acid transport system substrate-binding protein